jgi:hypothetical protein
LSKDKIATGQKSVLTIVRPRIVDLTVKFNADKQGNAASRNWAASVDAHLDIVVEVETNPDTEKSWLQVSWTGDIGGGVAGKPNRRKVSRSASGEYFVEAELNGEKRRVDILVRPKLLDLVVVSREAVHQGPAASRDWATAVDARSEIVIQVKTEPDTKWSWDQVNWAGDVQGDVPGKPNQKRVARSSSGKYHVEAEVGGETMHVDLWAIVPEVIEVSFGNQEPIVKWPGGSPVVGPEWKKSASPDLPVCFIKRANNVLVSPKVKLDPAAAPRIKISLKATCNDPRIEFQKDNVELAGAEMVVPNIPILTGTLEDTVKRAALTLDWSFSLGNGTQWTPTNRTGPHVVYQVFAKPIAKPLYDLALQKACAYVNGNADIAAAINRGIPAELTYDPAKHVTDPNPLSIYDEKKCLCMNNAQLMEYLCKSVGVDCEVVYVWGGEPPDTLIRYWRGSGLNPTHKLHPFVWVTFWVKADQKDDAEKDPHFTYHAQTIVDGKVYDPSYGNSGLIDLIETAPGAVRVTGPKWPPPEIKEYTWNIWRCPH